MNGVWSETGNSKGDAISASTEMQDVGMTLDNDLKTCWQGNKGDYITFALENGAKNRWSVDCLEEREYRRGGF